MPERDKWHHNNALSAGTREGAGGGGQGRSE